MRYRDQCRNGTFGFSFTMFAINPGVFIVKGAVYDEWAGHACPHVVVLSEVAITGFPMIP